MSAREYAQRLFIAFIRKEDTQTILEECPAHLQAMAKTMARTMCERIIHNLKHGIHADLIDTPGTHTIIQQMKIYREVRKMGK
jgi:hypothetical protein